MKRVWLPHDNVPGLAMSRALGDYSLKNYGVIAAPEVSYRQIMDGDKFIVLANRWGASILNFWCSVYD